MTLPKPLETERGTMRGLVSGPPGRPRTAVAPFVHALVWAADDGIIVAGQPLRVRGDRIEETEDLRAAMEERMLKRRPNPVPDTWRHLETVLAGALEGREVADQETKDLILQAIDGL